MNLKKKYGTTFYQSLLQSFCYSSLFTFTICIGTYFYSISIHRQTLMFQLYLLNICNYRCLPWALVNNNTMHNNMAVLCILTS